MLKAKTNTKLRKVHNSRHSSDFWSNIQENTNAKNNRLPIKSWVEGCVGSDCRIM